MASAQGKLVAQPVEPPPGPGAPQGAMTPCSASPYCTGGRPSRGAPTLLQPSSEMASACESRGTRSATRSAAGSEALQ